MATKTVEVNGVEYTLQKVPTNYWYKIKDRSKDKNGNPSEEKLYQEVLEHIVVNPKMKMEDFEEVEDFGKGSNGEFVIVHLYCFGIGYNALND